MKTANKHQQERIVALLRQGETAADNLRIGMEMEHLVVDAQTLESVNYYEEKGIETILKQLLPKGYDPIYEGEHLVGLRHPEYVITLEPGGQLEISIDPSDELEVIYRRYWIFLHHLLPVLEAQGQWLMAMGYHPRTSIHNLPFNPKKRYQYMSDYFRQTGRYAHYMMKGTASLQVIVDYVNETDFIEKFRVAHFLMPFLALLTDNAPFFEGEPAQQVSMRTAIWDETDPARCGLIPGVMDTEFGYQAYADYILRTPPILVQQGHEYHGTGDVPAAELEGFESFNDGEVDHLLSMVFPDVRVRRYIEIRMADSLPLPLSFGFAALVKNLFYREASLRYLYHLSQGMSDARLNQLRQDMQRSGYEARFGGTTCQQMLLTLLDLAKQEATSRELTWLAHLEELVLRQETPAAYSRRSVAAAGWQGLEWCAAHRWTEEETR